MRIQPVDPPGDEGPALQPPPDLRGPVADRRCAAGPRWSARRARTVHSQAHGPRPAPHRRSAPPAPPPDRVRRQGVRDPGRCHRICQQRQSQRMATAECREPGLQFGRHHEPGQQIEAVAFAERFEPAADSQGAPARDRSATATAASSGRPARRPIGRQRRQEVRAKPIVQRGQPVVAVDQQHRTVRSWGCRGWPRPCRRPISKAR